MYVKVLMNPAVLHGAGSNTSSDLLRLANLLQVYNITQHTHHTTQHNSRKM